MCIQNPDIVLYLEHEECAVVHAKTARGKSENETQTQGFEYHQQQQQHQKKPSAVATAINNSKCKCLIESARLIDLNPEIENNTQTPTFYCSTLSTLCAPSLH